MQWMLDDSLPIYIQLVEQIKNAIIAGEFAPGERLPSVRVLAAEARVNPNTMQKALAELEESKLVYTERTSGRFVTEDIQLLQLQKKQQADAVSRQYLVDMRQLGFSPEQAAEYLNTLGGEE